MASIHPRTSRTGARMPLLCWIQVSCALGAIAIMFGMGEPLGAVVVAVFCAALIAVTGSALRRG
jgi:hypothetical protein